MQDKQKIAIVTGASRGIGREVAKELAESGITVIANYNKSEEEAKKLQQELEEQNFKLEIFKADVSKREDVKKLVEYTIEKYGKIDISVLEIIPHTCSNTENPPNPNKKAEIIIFVEIFLIGILETIFTPFVSSIIPEIIPFEKLVGIFKAERIGFIANDKASNK